MGCLGCISLGRAVAATAASLEAMFAGTFLVILALGVINTALSAAVSAWPSFDWPSLGGHGGDVLTSCSPPPTCLGPRQVSQVAPSEEVGGLFGVMDAMESTAGIIGPTLGGVIAKAGDANGVKYAPLMVVRRVAAA